MIRKRRGHWHYRFQIDGQLFSGTIGLEDTERNRIPAMKFEEKRRREILRALAEQEIIPERMRFNHAAAEFLDWCQHVEYQSKPGTWKRIRSSFSSLITFFVDTPVSQITPGDIERFKTWRLSTLHVKAVSLRHDLHNFNLFVQYARKNRWLAGNPMEDVAIPSDAEAVRDNILTPEMEEAFFARAFEIKDRHGRRNLYDLGRLMILQGCRPEELMALHQEHVDLDQMTVRIVAGKSKAAKRTLALCDESAELLASRLDQKSPWVFPSDRTKGRPLATLQGPVDKVCRETGVSCVIYDLRHTFATRMIESGIDVMTVAKILGHANLRTIQRYVHLTDAHTKEAMANFQAAQARKKLKVVGGRG